MKRSSVRVSDLRPDPKNARRHPERNLAVIAGSLKDVGAARSIVIDERNVILAGNGVCEAAPLAGIERVRVVEADGDEIIAVRRTGLTNTQKTQLALADNRAGELSEWNPDAVKSIADSGVDLSSMWTLEELRTVFGQGVKPGKTDPDAVPEERATDICPGDLFALGAHRLLCGDSTKAEDVAAVLAGEVPLLMVTDPPYGVEYDPAWRAAAGVNRNTKKLGTVTNDDTADWTAAWRLFPGDVAYVWHAGLKASIVEASLEVSGFELRSQIIWAKDRMALSRGDYHWQHEPCWYAVRRGAQGQRTDDRSQTTLWSIPARDDSGHGHGTQKPVECMARAIRNHAAPAVYEPFSGSGTTLLAAEQLGRTCYAIEIEPRYCQVSLDRWEAFTGQKAVKVGEAVLA